MPLSNAQYFITPVYHDSPPKRIPGEDIILTFIFCNIMKKRTENVIERFLVTRKRREP
jgi:hypothetical protein